MALPWKVIEAVDVPKEGRLELRQRGERDFLIVVGRQILMNSAAHRSEAALGSLACAKAAHAPSPKVLIGGLGMGYTLRAVLDTLPPDGVVLVSELNPAMVRWCRGPLAGLTGSAVNDIRVTVEISDVARLVKREGDRGELFDAVVYDLYRGPHARTDRVGDPLYGSRAIGQVRKILKPGGVFAVWGENYDEGFHQRLTSAGFTVAIHRPGRGGLRHAVFIATC